MFSSLSSALAASASSSPQGKSDKKSISPSLRTDIYNTIDQAKPWLIGASPRQAGDGVSYQPILSLIQSHFPELKVGLDAARNVEHESAVIVAGITNMILEMSKWDGMAGAMAMRTWVDALGDAHGKISISGAPSTGAKGASRKDQVGRGITRGINQLTDVTLMTREFAARIQIISLLKSVNTKIHGAGSDEARQGEALWSSKFI